MIDWVDARLRTWGLAKRRIEGRRPVKLKDCLFESGNARSFLGRFREGGHVGKGKGLSRLVEPLECLSGDALLVSMAVRLAIQAGNIDDKQYELLFLHYVAKASNRRKMKTVNMDRKTYWESLHIIHIRLIGWLSAASSRQEKLSKIMGMEESYESA